MKKFFVMAIAVAAVLTGCVTNEEFGDDVQPEIKMEAVTKVANRAIVEGATVPEDFNFTVFGFYSANSFANTQQFAMYDVDCTKQGEFFKHSTQSYYWPMSGEVGFYAVSPSIVEPAVIDWYSGITLTNHTVVGAEDVDVMFAYNKGSNQSAALGMVFYHALAQAEVLVNTDKEYQNVELKVTGITFKNIDITANCTYKESSPADQTPNPSIEWSGNTDSTGSEVYSVEEHTVVYNSTQAQPYGSGVVVIPQTMDTEVVTTPTVSTISIGYSLAQYGGAAITGTIEKPITTAWERGSKYVYTLTFKLNEILFNPSATDWVTVNADAISIE